MGQQTPDGSPSISAQAVEINVNDALKLGSGLLVISALVVTGLFVPPVRGYITKWIQPSALTAIRKHISGIWMLSKNTAEGVPVAAFSLRIRDDKQES